MLLFWALKWAIGAILLHQLCSASILLFQHYLLLGFNWVFGSMSKFDATRPIKTIFDGSNFEVWSREMSSFLKDCNLWRYATGDISKPVKHKDGDEIKYNKRLKKWDRRNHRILTWIRNTCASSIEPQFDHFETAQQVWDFLFQRYSIFNQYQLCEELFSLKQQKGQSLDDFFSTMKTIWDQLALFEPKLSSSEDAIKFAEYQKKLKVMQFLLAIHEDYEPARTSLLCRGNFPQLESVVAELLTEETSLSILKNHPTNSTEVPTTAPTSLNDLQAHHNQRVRRDSNSLALAAATGKAMTSSKKTHKSHPEHPLAKMNCASGYICNGCGMDGKGLRYRCEHNGCDFDLHEECMLAIPILTFQGHECEFFEELPVVCKSRKRRRADCDCRRCDACGLMIKGFVYHCAEDGMNFHPKCAMLQSEIPPNGDVKFRLQKEGPTKCQLCGKKQLKGTTEKVPGWSYVNKYGCDFHVHCVMNKLMNNRKGSSKGSITTEEDLSLALGGMVLTLKTKSKGSGGKDAKYWFKILKTFFTAVSSILLGDPTALLASIVTEALQN